MPSVSSYFNPCSRDFQSCSDFARLNIGKRIGVVILTALAAIFSLGFFAVPVSRLLINRFKSLNTKALPPTPVKTNQIAQKTIATPIITAAQNTISVQTISNPKTNPAPVSPLAFTQLPTHIPLQPSNIPPQPAPQSTITPFVPESTPQPLSLPPQTTHIPYTYKIAGPRNGNIMNEFDHAIGNGFTLTNPRSLTDNLPDITKVTRALIENRLHSIGKWPGESVYSGDSFLHSFAQSYNYQRPNQTPLIVEDLRAILNKEVPDQIWELDDGSDTDETLQQGEEVPSRGDPTKEGQRFCEHFGVNLKIYKASIQGLSSKKAAKLLTNENDLTNYVKEAGYTHNDIVKFEEDQSASINTGGTLTVEMVVYTDHYLPVFNID